MNELCAAFASSSWKESTGQSRAEVQRSLASPHRTMTNFRPLWIGACMQALDKPFPPSY